MADDINRILIMKILQRKKGKVDLRHYEFDEKKIMFIL